MDLGSLEVLRHVLADFGKRRERAFDLVAVARIHRSGEYRQAFDPILWLDHLHEHGNDLRCHAAEDRVGQAERRKYRRLDMLKGLGRYARIVKVDIVLGQKTGNRACRDALVRHLEEHENQVVDIVRDQTDRVEALVSCAHAPAQSGAAHRVQCL